MSLKCDARALRFACRPIYAALIKSILYQAPTLLWTCILPMEAKNLVVDWWLLNDTRGTRENTHTLTLHPQRPVPLLLSFPRSESTGDADEDLLGRGVLRTVMILASSSSGHLIQLVRFSRITRINLKKPKAMFLMGKSRDTGGTAADLCTQEIRCAFLKSAWVTECKLSLGSSWRQGFIQHFSL